MIGHYNPRPKLITAAMKMQQTLFHHFSDLLSAQWHSPRPFVQVPPLDPAPAIVLTSSGSHSPRNSLKASARRKVKLNQTRFVAMR